MACGACTLSQRSYTCPATLAPASTAELFGRLIFQLGGVLEAWWEPVYLRMDVELTLTPVPSDAGADVTLYYGAGAPPDGAPPEAAAVLPSASASLGLVKHDLPSALWPAPSGRAPGRSPFSKGARDYMRPVAPGVYVGCAYMARGRTAALSAGSFAEDDFVFFMLVRRPP